MSHKNIVTKEDVKFEPVFRLKPYRNQDNDAICDIKHVGYISPTDGLGDEPIKIETTPEENKAFGPNTHYMGRLNGYDITVNAYRNNMTGNYLISNNNLPVISLQFMYSKNIVTGFLFNIFIYLVIDKEKNEHLKTPQSYVGARVYGKYIMVVDCDKELHDNLNTLLEEKIEEYAMEDIANDINNDNNLTDDELVIKVKENIDEKKEFYSKLLKGVEVSNYKNIQKFSDEHLVPLYKNKHINGLLKFALDIRNKKRVKEYGSFEGEYKIPERVLKLSDYKNNPELIDKYFGVEDDSD